jgi:minimal PKS acyl carrier protein
MNAFTFDELRKTIGSCLGSDTATELTEASLDVELHELGYDSLTVYEFVMKLQDELAIKITDQDIDTMNTPRAVIDFVNGQLARRQSCTT